VVTSMRRHQRRRQARRRHLRASHALRRIKRLLLVEAFLKEYK